MSNLQELFEKLKPKRSTSSDENSDAYYLIAGLGNPGKDYVSSRHNVGFMVVDVIAQRLGASFSRVEQRALIEKITYHGQRVLLAKPQTFMNNSGQSVAGLAKFYKIPNEHILVIYDDVDLEFEKIRIRPQGSSGGQKGIKSVIHHLGTEVFARMKVGVDRPPGKMKTPDYVLQNFSKKQKENLSLILDKAADGALRFVTKGVESAMNEYNGHI